MKVKHDAAAVLMTSIWIKKSKMLYNSVDISFIGFFSCQNRKKKNVKESWICVFYKHKNQLHGPASTTKQNDLKYVLKTPVS